MLSCCPASYSWGLQTAVSKSQLKGYCIYLTDPRTEHPWIVEITLSSFNEEDLEIVVEVRKSAT